MIEHFSIGSTKESLTSRAGLTLLSQYINKTGLLTSANQLLPKPGSNRGFSPSVFINAAVTMLHAGGRCLEDLRLLKKDSVYTSLLTQTLPSSDALGQWLRRTGSSDDCMEGLELLNRKILVHRYLSGICPSTPLVLDIDATGIQADKKEAKWTYKHYKGYMPIVAHVNITPSR